LSNEEEHIIDVEIRIGHGDNDPIHIFYEIQNTLIPEGKVFLGDKSLKICRFCKQDSNQTTFKKIAHVIPEFMGNKKYFSNFECDKCNDLFSAYETSLASYGGILNTFSLIKGKNGHPKHKGNIEATETFVRDGQVVIRIHNPESRDSVKSVQYNEKTGLMTFNTTKYSYVPLDAYKALTKIGLCMLTEDEVLDYELTCKWLIKETELDAEIYKPFFLVFQKTGERLFPHPWTVLLKKRNKFANEPCPTHALLINYGLFRFQIFLLGNSKDQWIWKGNRLTLPIENLISHSNKDLEKQLSRGFEIVDFSSAEKLINPRHSFRVPFKSKK
jgi:hypothetical protein